METELVFLFRHALVRDAAYELQPPAARALLHRHALEAFEALVPGDDAYAEELADHAHAAQAMGADPELAAREVDFLVRAGTLATGQFRNEDALRCWSRVVNHPAADDATKVSAAIKCANTCCLTESLDDASAYAHLAYKLAGDDEIRRLEAEKAIAWTDGEAGRLRQAWDRATQCIDRLRELGDKPTLASLLSDAGTYARRLGLIREGIAMLSEARQLAMEVGNRHGEAASLGNLAGAYLMIHELEESRTSAMAAMELALEQNEPAVLGIAYDILGTIARTANQPSESERFYLLAVENHRKMGNRRATGVVMANLALLRQDQGRLDEAREMLLEALQYQRETGDLRGECSALGNLAENLHRNGRLDEAAVEFRRALELARTIHHRLAEAYWGASLGIVSYEQGRLDDAAHYFDEAWPLAEQLSDKRLIGQIRAHRAFMLRREADPRAEDEWLAAQELMSELADELPELRRKWQNAEAQTDS